VYCFDGEVSVAVKLHFSQSGTCSSSAVFCTGGVFGVSVDSFVSFFGLALLSCFVSARGSSFLFENISDFVSSD